VRIGIVALSCSLILSIAACARAIDYEQINGKLTTAGEDQAQRIAEQVSDDPNTDDAVTERAINFIEAEPERRKEFLLQFKAAVETRARAQSATKLAGKDELRKLAQSAKNSPLFTDPETKKQSNWIGKGFQGLKDLRFPEVNLGDRGPKMSGIPYGFIYVVWALLIGALLFLGFLAFKHFSWKRTLTRKAKALLEEDEPERTLDEWLELADKLAAEGKHREAVRCLYLACLLRFDEHLVARFERGQTNWEHLARIQASSKLPIGLDFEPPTKRFDTVWYGQRTRGILDVDQFREGISA
jgi:hypothetical protein